MWILGFIILCGLLWLLITIIDGLADPNAKRIPPWDRGY